MADVPVGSTDIPLDSFQFQEEIYRLIVPPPDTNSSFTSLLERPHSRALHLLHNFPSSHGGFSANSAPPKVKEEPAPESDCDPNSSSQPLVSDPPVDDKASLLGKRKDREKKAKGTAKKSKSGGEDAEKLPYVHVRAGRGQATDSHSLAERARREKINARMKLLQDLVPGCNKISGTALVLDEIINHVQSLQRKVELLSMQLAAVNPCIDFNLDSIFAAESASMADGNFPNMFDPVSWSELHGSILRQQYQQHLWHLNPFQHQAWGGEDRSSPNMIASDNSHLSYDSPVNSASIKVAEIEATKVE